MQTVGTTTIASALWPRTDGNDVVRLLILSAVGVAVIAAGAAVRLPFWPVPMTLQSLAVLVIGMAYGRHLGVLTVVLYLAAGVVGLPVFASSVQKGAGLHYLTGPTGGYLLGFLGAAYLSGRLAEQGWDRAVMTAAGVNAIGTAVIWGCGLTWLGAHVGFDGAIDAGLTPFMPSAIAKIVLGALLMPLLWRYFLK